MLCGNRSVQRMLTQQSISISQRRNICFERAGMDRGGVKMFIELDKMDGSVVSVNIKNIKSIEPGLFYHKENSSTMGEGSRIYFVGEAYAHLALDVMQSYDEMLSMMADIETFKE